MRAVPTDPASAVLVWLGYINFLLAAFNMIPGFPLDGGRVLRGIIWWITGARNRSTRIAAQVGEAVGYAFIVTGVLRFFGGAGLGGLWIAFIGWFLLEAARSSQAEIGMTEMLRGIRVEDVMSRDSVTVDGRSNLQTFADEHLLRSGRRCFVVTENGRVAGLITPHEVRHIPHSRWPYTTIQQVDGKPIADSNELRMTVSMMRPGANVKLRVLRSYRCQPLESSCRGRPPRGRRHSGSQPQTGEEYVGFRARREQLKRGQSSVDQPKRPHDVCSCLRRSRQAFSWNRAIFPSLR